MAGRQVPPHVLVGNDINWWHIMDRRRGEWMNEWMDVKNSCDWNRIKIFSKHLNKLQFNSNWRALRSVLLDYCIYSCSAAVVQFSAVGKNGLPKKRLNRLGRLLDLQHRRTTIDRGIVPGEEEAAEYSVPADWTERTTTHLHNGHCSPANFSLVQPNPVPGERAFAVHSEYRSRGPEKRFN